MKMRLVYWIRPMPRVRLLRDTLRNPWCGLDESNVRQAGLQRAKGHSRVLMANETKERVEF